MCVNLFQLRKQHLVPELYPNGTQNPTIGEAKSLGQFMFKIFTFDLKETSNHHRKTELKST